MLIKTFKVGSIMTADCQVLRRKLIVLDLDVCEPYRHIVTSYNYHRDVVGHNDYNESLKQHYFQFFIQMVYQYLFFLIRAFAFLFEYLLYSQVIIFKCSFNDINSCYEGTIYLGCMFSPQAQVCLYSNICEVIASSQVNRTPLNIHVNERPLLQVG